MGKPQRATGAATRFHLPRHLPRYALGLEFPSRPVAGRGQGAGRRLLCAGGRWLPCRGVRRVTGVWALLGRRDAVPEGFFPRPGGTKASRSPKRTNPAAAGFVAPGP